jgi:hypothetical protein
MMNFDQGLCNLVRSITSLKGRTDHLGKIHLQIMADLTTGRGDLDTAHVPRPEYHSGPAFSCIPTNRCSSTGVSRTTRQRLRGEWTER